MPVDKAKQIVQYRQSKFMIKNQELITENITPVPDSLRLAIDTLAPCLDKIVDVRVPQSITWQGKESRALIGGYPEDNLETSAFDGEWLSLQTWTSSGQPDVGCALRRDTDGRWGLTSGLYSYEEVDPDTKEGVLVCLGQMAQSVTERASDQAPRANKLASQIGRFLSRR